MEAGEKPISDVFSDKYAFSIPPYQRPYAWEVPQVTALLEDLLDAMNPETGGSDLYFLGSIVLVKTPNSPKAKVVDGQQRLTTLTILFSVLRDLTEDDNRRASRGKYVKQPADPDQLLEEILRLQLRPKDQPFFRDYVQKELATKSLPKLDSVEGSQARIVENTNELTARLTKMSETDRTKLISFILKNCFLVVVEVPTDKAARRIFTVLNARGMDLTATDILKADLLERAGELKEQELSTRWEDIELALDRRLFSDLFTHIRMIFQREKPRSSLEVGFPEFVTPFKADPDEFISQTLSPFADALIEIEQGSNKIAEKFGQNTSDLVKSLTRLDNKDWIPPLMLAFKLHTSGEDIDIPNVVQRLERVAYFLFVTRTDVNGRMHRYADIMNEISPQENFKEKTTGLDITQGEAFALFSALDGPIYRSSRVVKPLLLRLDQSLTDGSASYDYPVISVEHVCPQTIAPKSQWSEWFSDQEDHDYWLHRLGNLVLLNKRKNSAASNWDLDKKKTKYFVDGDATPFQLTQQVLKRKKWKPKHIEKRQEKVLTALAKTWDLSDQFETWWDLED